MNGELLIVDDVPTAFAQCVQVAFGNRQDDDFSLALSGGSAARSCYEALAREPIDWGKVSLFWGDERLVPLDDADSNYRIAKEALLDQISPPCNVFPMTAEEGADAYGTRIRAALPLDFAHLGMGADGHTASLFPDSSALEAPTDQLVVTTSDDRHEHPRMTLTYSALNQARLVVFTVMGEKKREMLGRIVRGEHLPAGRVAAHRIIWLVDQAAAGS